MQKQIINRKKIKIIDVIFILLLLLIVIGVLSRFRRHKSTVYVDLTYERNDFDGWTKPPEYWAVAEISKGDIVYSDTGEEIAKISDIQKTFWQGGTRLYTTMQLEMDVLYDTSKKKYVLNGRNLLIGNELNLHFDKTKFKGVVKNIYDSKDDRYKDYQKASGIVKVKYKSLEPWHADSLKDLVVTDTDGNMIAKVTDFKIEDAEVSLREDNFSLAQGVDSSKRDVELDFYIPKILCRNNSCYFNETSALLIGNYFSVDSGDKYAIGGSIMKIDLDYSGWK